MADGVQDETPDLLQSASESFCVFGSQLDESVHVHIDDFVLWSEPEGDEAVISVVCTDVVPC